MGTSTSSSQWRVPAPASALPLQALHARERIWPESLKQSKTVQMPGVRKSTNRLHWPAEMLAVLYNCTFAHQFPRRKKKVTMRILLLRSGSCLPSPVSHSLIKSLLLIRLVPKSMFCHEVLWLENLIYCDLNWRVYSDLIYKLFCVISQQLEISGKSRAEKSAVPSPATLKVT